MLNKITVILARANWCGHCHRFKPIFEESMLNYTEDEYLKNQDIEFVNYDLADDTDETNFTFNHYEGLKMIEGYVVASNHFLLLACLFFIPFPVFMDDTSTETENFELDKSFSLNEMFPFIVLKIPSTPVPLNLIE